MCENKKGFIAQTADDYDLPYDVVELVYINSTIDEFYDRLENIIKDRGSISC